MNYDMSTKKPIIAKLKKLGLKADETMSEKKLLAMLAEAEAKQSETTDTTEESEESESSEAESEEEETETTEESEDSEDESEDEESDEESEEDESEEETTEDSVDADEKVDGAPVRAISFKIRNINVKEGYSIRTFSKQTHGPKFQEIAAEFEESNTHQSNNHEFNKNIRSQILGKKIEK